MLEKMTNHIALGPAGSVTETHTFIHNISLNAFMVTLTMKEAYVSNDGPLLEEVPLLSILLASCCIVLILITTTLLRGLIAHRTVAEADIVDTSAISKAAL